MIKGETIHKSKNPGNKAIAAGTFILIIIIVNFIGCSRSPEDSALQFKVLQETKLDDGISRWHLWVADTLSKVQVMTIAMGLLDKYDEFVIYDSRDAFENRLNEDYPLDELYSHLLVIRRKGERPEWMKQE